MSAGAGTGVLYFIDWSIWAGPLATMVASGSAFFIAWRAWRLTQSQITIGRVPLLTQERNRLRTLIIDYRKLLKVIAQVRELSESVDRRYLNTAFNQLYYVPLIGDVSWMRMLRECENISDELLLIDCVREIIDLTYGQVDYDDAKRQFGLYGDKVSAELNALSDQYDWIDKEITSVINGKRGHHSAASH